MVKISRCDNFLLFALRSSIFTQSAFFFLFQLPDLQNWVYQTTTAQSEEKQLFSLYVAIFRSQWTTCGDWKDVFHQIHRRSRCKCRKWLKNSEQSEKLRLFLFTFLRARFLTRTLWRNQKFFNRIVAFVVTNCNAWYELIIKIGRFAALYKMKALAIFPLD